MDISAVIGIVLIIAAIAAIAIYFLARRRNDEVGTSTAKPMQFNFCIGTYVNSQGVTRKALGVKVVGSEIYYCIKNTVHDVDYKFISEQINWFKNKFAKVYSDNCYHELIYFNSNPVEPLEII